MTIFTNIFLRLKLEQLKSSSKSSKFLTLNFSQNFFSFLLLIHWWVLLAIYLFSFSLFQVLTSLKENDNWAAFRMSVGMIWKTERPIGERLECVDDSKTLRKCVKTLQPLTSMRLRSLTNQRNIFRCFKSLWDAWFDSKSFEFCWLSFGGAIKIRADEWH